MMTPLRFEQLHHEEWSELEIAIGSVGTQTVAKSMSLSPAPGARVALLYRRACEHLALARSRAYPAYIVDRLERVTEDAHQLIYHRPELGLSRLRHVLAYEFPAAVRAHRRYVAMAAAVFVLPTLIVGALVYARPELILSVVSAETAASFEEHVFARRGIDRTSADRVDRLDHARPLHPQQHRRRRSSASPAGCSRVWARCSSSPTTARSRGRLPGISSERGLASTFFSFVATHSAFELTAIVLSGAAGLRIGHSLLAPGRLRRRPALVRAAQDTAVLLYGVVAMLIVAAFVEAFWSSARWLPPAVKYSVAAICWTAVLLYLTRQGRHAG